MTCKYHNQCSLFRKEAVVCIHGDSYCGRYRDFEEGPVKEVYGKRHTTQLLQVFSLENKKKA
jgi:hypothetical protein